MDETGLKTDLTGYQVIEHYERVRLAQSGQETITVKHNIQAIKGVTFQSGRVFDGTFAVSLKPEGDYFMQVNVSTKPDMSMDEWDEHAQFMAELRTKGSEVKAEVSHGL